MTQLNNIPLPIALKLYQTDHYGNDNYKFKYL